MPRRTEIRGGTFGRIVGAGVYANGWWLLHAADVDLRCESPSYHELSNVTGRHEPLDPTRVRRRLPVALQMAAGQELPIGFVAGRVEDAPEGGKMDVAYPFLLQEFDGRMLLAFGSGPEPLVRAQIVAAFVQRIAWGEP